MLSIDAYVLSEPTKEFVQLLLILVAYHLQQLSQLILYSLNLLLAVWAEKDLR